MKSLHFRPASARWIHNRVRTYLIYVRHIRVRVHTFLVWKKKANKQIKTIFFLIYRPRGPYTKDLPQASGRGQSFKVYEPPGWQLTYLSSSCLHLLNKPRSTEKAALQNLLWKSFFLIDNFIFSDGCLAGLRGPQVMAYMESTRESTGHHW